LFVTNFAFLNPSLYTKYFHPACHIFEMTNHKKAGSKELCDITGSGSFPASGWCHSSRISQTGTQFVHKSYMV